MKATSESLRNMRVLKLHAWDETYLAKIEDLRGKEFGWMWRHALVMASTVYTFWTAPILVSTATFSTCVGLGIPLSAGKILTALATCRILQGPLDVFPEFIANFAQTRVSSRITTSRIIPQSLTLSKCFITMLGCPFLLVHHLSASVMTKTSSPLCFRSQCSASGDFCRSLSFQWMQLYTFRHVWMGVPLSWTL
jgi:hypothetical protein